MKKLIFRLSIFLLGSLHVIQAAAQDSQIQGRILSASQNAPLQGVSVALKGKTAGTQTDASGKFSIKATAGDVLQVSYTGFVSQEIKVGKQSDLVIYLAANESDLDEVVVIGYGTQKKSKITGSVSKLDNRVIQSGVRFNPASALAGTIPGLRVQQTSGRPGAVPNIVLKIGRAHV